MPESAGTLPKQTHHLLAAAWLLESHLNERHPPPPLCQTGAGEPGHSPHLLFSRQPSAQWTSGALVSPSSGPTLVGSLTILFYYKSTKFLNWLDLSYSCLSPSMPIMSVSLKIKQNPTNLIPSLLWELQLPGEYETTSEHLNSLASCLGPLAVLLHPALLLLPP